MNKYKIKSIDVSNNDTSKTFTIRVKYPEKIVIKYLTKEVHINEYETMLNWSEEDWIGYILKGMCDICKDGKEPKYFYRVENPTTMNGLWYNQEGEFTGLIHDSKFASLQNHTLPMPFDKSIVGWLSVAESREELDKWFSKDDMKILYPLGYRITKYLSHDYKKVNNHYVINQKTARRVSTFINKRYEKVPK